MPSGVDVLARRLGRTLLIFVPLVICAARVHAGRSGTPTSVTQEVARCLNMVRVAVTRRNTPGTAATRSRHAGRHGSPDPAPGS